MRLSNWQRVVLGLTMVAAVVPLRAITLLQADNGSSVSDSSFDLANDTIGVSITIEGARLKELSVTDRIRNTSITIADPFSILLKDGTIYNAQNLRLSQAAPVKIIPANPNASRMAERRPGKELDL